MSRQLFLSLLLSAPFLVSCGNDDSLTPEREPMTFSVPQTRATLSSLYDNFKVWTTAITDATPAYVMDGYRVNYDATAGWTYTMGEGTAHQTLCYWEPTTQSYRFHAATPTERVVAMDGASLTLKLKASTSLSETCLYSQPRVVSHGDADFGQAVKLDFTYANARVNMSFRCVSSTPLAVTDIRLIPPTPYATSASLRFAYDWQEATVAVDGVDVTVQSSEPLAFPDVAVPAHSEGAIETSVPWLMIPNPSVKGTWRASMTIGGEHREVAFTIDNAWEPGHSYVYCFLYTEAANLVFVGTSTELFVGEDPQEGGEHQFN